MHKKHTIKIRRATFLGLLFFVVLGFLIINNNHAQAALLNPYNKLNGGTLQASEWNNLLADFVTKNNGGDNLFGDYTITGTLASSTYALDITGALRATSVTGALSGTLSSANVSAGLFGDNTGGGNYNFPANIGIGIGTTTPPSIITLANDRWVSARNSAGNGYVNIFKVNANDEIEIGGALNIGNFQFPADSGFNTFVDMPVTSASPNDSIQGYVMKIDGDNILTVFSQSDGLGGIKNRRIGINTSTPQFDLDVAGIINATDIYVNGAPYIGSQWTTNGTSIYYNTGNVGIGTTAPNRILEIAGSGSTGRLRITDIGSTGAGVDAGVEFANSVGTIKGFVGEWDSNSEDVDLRAEVGGLNFVTAGNDVMYINTSGNVGIGTTSPQALLDVNGLIKMR
ncbi:MAG: hypothetical protein RBT30_03855, partial [Patescibacteria group bacterium]|nr:hypothetical protein [Patescibacteria group bacterium]